MKFGDIPPRLVEVFGSSNPEQTAASLYSKNIQLMDGHNSPWSKNLA
jgi:hypothetical protein